MTGGYYDEYGPRDESGSFLSPPYRRGIHHWEEFFGSVADKIAEQLAASGPSMPVAPSAS